MRVGVVIDAQEFPEARRPALKLSIDFGPLGVKRSSAQITDRYTPAALVGRRVVAVVNFPPKRIGPVRLGGARARRLRRGRGGHPAAARLRGLARGADRVVVARGGASGRAREAACPGHADSHPWMRRHDRATRWDVGGFGDAQKPRSRAGRPRARPTPRDPARSALAARRRRPPRSPSLVRGARGLHFSRDGCVPLRLRAAFRADRAGAGGAAGCLAAAGPGPGARRVGGSPLLASCRSCCEPGIAWWRTGAG